MHARILKMEMIKLGIDTKSYIRDHVIDQRKVFKEH